jgi:hypothetical protein
MTKFIKLMNDADAHKGNPIYINTDHITAVYEAQTQNGGIKTFVYGGFTGVVWEVEETPKQVIDMIMPVEYL